VALVRKQTIPIEQPPLVGEVSANFFRIKGVAWSAQQTPTAVNLGFLDQNRYFSIQVAQLFSRCWVDPVPDLLLLIKYGSSRNWIRDLWICSQELWPLDHRVKNTSYVSNIGSSGNNVCLSLGSTDTDRQSLQGNAVIAFNKHHTWGTSRAPSSSGCISSVMTNMKVSRVPQTSGAKICEWSRVSTDWWLKKET
jgi:hypothetical protein